jgi:hypothetical protein
MLRSSGETTLCVREDSAEAQKSKNPSGFERKKLRRNNVFIGERRRTQSREFAERKRRQRLRPLGIGILPSAGKKVHKLRREHSSRQIGGEEEIWTIGFYVQEEAGGAHRRMDLTVGS